MEKEQKKYSTAYDDARNILKLVGFGTLTVAGFVFVSRKANVAEVERYARETERYIENEKRCQVSYEEAAQRYGKTNARLSGGRF